VSTIFFRELLVYKSIPVDKERTISPLWGVMFRCTIALRLDVVAASEPIKVRILRETDEENVS
jgi:hypothetical protein